MDGHRFLTRSLTDKMTQADDGGEFIAKCQAQYEALSQQVNDIPTELLGTKDGNYGPRAIKFDRQPKYSMLRPAVHTGFGSFVRKEKTYSSAKSYNLSTQKWSHVGTSFKWTNEVQPQVARTNSKRPEFRQRNDMVQQSTLKPSPPLSSSLKSKALRWPTPSAPSSSKWTYARPLDVLNASRWTMPSTKPSRQPETDSL